MNDWSGKRVVVMGLGRFGGGVGVTRWLAGQGARVLVTDLAPEKDLAESVAALAGLDVSYRLGGHDERDLDACDLLVVNPAVDKARSDFFQAARRRGIPWMSEMNLFLERCPARVVGVTGSVGKSTTAAMIGAALEAAGRSPGWAHGRVWLGGNIGKSLLDDLPAMKADDVVVLELSSFQLEDAAVLRRSPHLAVVTNLRENHLDRHGTMAEYAAAKANIYRFQIENDWLVMPRNDGARLFPPGWEKRTNLVRFDVGAEPGRIRLSLPHKGGRYDGELSVKLSIPGVHNLRNAAAAMAVVWILRADRKAALDALAAFKALPHRLEFVREYRGVRYYNDSKATTPDATMTSLSAFDGGVVVIVGGSDKGSSFAQLGRVLAERAAAVVCMGQTAGRIFEALEAACPPQGGPRRAVVPDMGLAVTMARKLARPGDVVLLSPACASYDMFRNYEHRGEMFRKIVEAWD